MAEIKCIGILPYYFSLRIFRFYYNILSHKITQNFAIMQSFFSQSRTLQSATAGSIPVTTIFDSPRHGNVALYCR